MLKLTHFDLSDIPDIIDVDIVNLTGLEYATNLVDLDLNHNAIVDVSPLKGLTKLEEFFLVNNAIVDVSALKGLTNLNSLLLEGNPLSQESVEIHIPAIKANGTIVSYD